jgi:hypothetical protein
MLLRQIIDHMILHISSANLFPSPTVIHFRPEINTCPICHKTVKVLKTHPGKKAATLVIGNFIGHETVFYCQSCGHVFHSKELRALIPENCNFGYDIIVFIGESLFLRCRNYQEIRLELQQRNIQISESEIAFLAKKFVLYLGLLHKLSGHELEKYMHMNGGYILHLDGTCDGGSPHLISVLDGISKIVLDNRKLPSENADDLIPFLKGIRESYGDPIAVVSDMGKGIALAVKEVFRDVPAFICHFHFLKAIGKNLFGDENDIIRKDLRKHNVRVTLRRTKKRLEAILDGMIDLVPKMTEGVKHEKFPEGCPLGRIPILATYTLISWVLDASAESNGFGFPFDQSYLVFYQRLHEASLCLHQLYEIQLQGNWRENKVYSKISHDLYGVVNDPDLKRAARRMEEKVAVFNRLRKAMRITLPENKRGLNDNGGQPVNMKTIEKEVVKFRNRLLKSKEYSEHKEYRKLLLHINLYREKLFADPIVVTTAGGKMLVQPQRTNNILEQFFRRLMRGYRKKNGFNSVERVIRTMLPDTPLTMNLKNKEYMKIILAGKKTLEERFAEIEARDVRIGLAQSRIEISTVHPEIKKIIRTPNLPKLVVSLLEQAAS